MYVVLASSQSWILGFLIRVPPGVSSPHRISAHQPVYQRAHNQHVNVETYITGQPIRLNVRIRWRMLNLWSQACRQRRSFRPCLLHLRRGTDIARGYLESADRVPRKQRHETAGNWGNMTGILIFLEKSCSELRSTSGKFRGTPFQHHCHHIGLRTPPSHAVITHRNRPQITLASQLDANSTNTQLTSTMRRNRRIRGPHPAGISETMDFNIVSANTNTRRQHCSPDTEG